METLEFPIASSVLKLDTRSFTLKVWVDGVAVYTISKGDGLFAISTTATALVISQVDSHPSLETQMLLDNTRSFESSYGETNTCKVGIIGVQDIRDMRTTYWWCVSSCPVVLTLTEVVVEGLGQLQDALIVYRTSDAPACYTEKIN